MAFSAVLLDIDGTLVESNEFHVLAWHRAFEDSGISIAMQSIRKQIGKGADMLIPTLAPDLPNERRETIAHRHGTIFKTQFLHRVQPFACAYDLIDALH